MKGMEFYDNIVQLRGSCNLCLGYLKSLKMKECDIFYKNFRRTVIIT